VLRHDETGRQDAELQPSARTDYTSLQRVKDAALDAELAEPVPAHVLRAAYKTFAWRLGGADLAVLGYDSDLDGAEPNVGRLGETRLLTFRLPRAGLIEVRVITAAHRSLCLRGQILPPCRGDVRVFHSRGRTFSAVDDLGCFAARRIGPGPMTLRLKLAEAGCDIATESITL
jgi:hypothetical protein